MWCDGLDQHDSFGADFECRDIAVTGIVSAEEERGRVDYIVWHQRGGPMFGFASFIIVAGSEMSHQLFMCATRRLFGRPSVLPRGWEYYIKFSGFIPSGTYHCAGYHTAESIIISLKSKHN